MNLIAEIILMKLLNHADDGCYYCCCFPMQFDDSYIYILLLFCELTPSAGIAALWASAGNEG